MSVCATVLYEKAGDQIAHVKFTVLLQSGGTTKITGLPLPSGFDVRHVYVYVCVRICTRSCLCGCICTHTCICVNICMWMDGYVCVGMHVFVDLYVIHVSAHAHMYINT